MSNGKPEVVRLGTLESALAHLCEHRMTSNDDRTRFPDEENPKTCPHCGADNSNCKGIDGPMRQHGACLFFEVDTGIRYEEVRCSVCKRTIGKRAYYRLRFT